MLKAVLGYITTVMAVMLDAALGVVGRPRRLAWVEVALFFVGRREPVLGALSEAEGQLRRRPWDLATLGALGETGSAPPSVAGFRDRGGRPPDQQRPNESPWAGVWRSIRA